MTTEETRPTDDDDRRYVGPREVYTNIMLSSAVRYAERPTEHNYKALLTAIEMFRGLLEDLSKPLDYRGDPWPASDDTTQEG